MPDAKQPRRATRAQVRSSSRRLATKALPDDVGQEVGGDQGAQNRSLTTGRGESARHRFSVSGVVRPIRARRAHSIAM
jgi:hypothetical protein